MHTATVQNTVHVGVYFVVFVGVDVKLDYFDVFGVSDVALHDCACRTYYNYTSIYHSLIIDPHRNL